MNYPTYDDDRYVDGRVSDAPNIWDGADYDTQDAAYEAALYYDRICGEYLIQGFDVVSECVRKKHKDNPHRDKYGTTWDEGA